MNDSLPLLDLAAAERLVAQWHRNRLTVGWTNGCFDVLHPGHVQMLAFARAHCDRLIVGINSDVSVRRLKGANRPYHTLSQRALVLGSIRSVDAIVEIRHDAPVLEVMTLRPDLAIKDDSYLTLPVPERTPLERSGGRMLFFPRVEGCSTTAILRDRG